MKQELFQQASIFHFCSGTLFHPTARQTTRDIVNQMEKSHVLLSFDANIRPLRWESEELCREIISSFFNRVDILKLTEEELFFLTETKTREEGISKLRDFQIPIVLITVGAEGTYIVIDNETIHVEVKRVIPVDTTGAGDAFMAGILSKINLNGKPNTKEEWIDYVSFGNRLGAICATKPGALSAMPRAAEL